MKSTKNTGHTIVSLQPHVPGGSFLHHIWASIAFTVTLGIICCGIYPAIVWGLSQLIFPNQANGSLVKKDGTLTSNDQDKDIAGSALLGQNFSANGYFWPRPSAAGNGYDPTSSGGSNLGPLSDKLINGVTTPATTQPTTQPESLSFDGVRLRTIHYALANNIPFKLFHAVYVKKDDGTYDIQRKEEIPIKPFLDASGNPIDTALVDAFPHPVATSEDFTRTLVIAGDFGTPIPGDAVTASGSGLDPHISPDNAKLQEGRVASARNIKPEQVEALLQEHTDQPSLGFLGDPGVNVLMLNLALDSKYPIPAPPATQPVTAPPVTQPATK